ncbi:MAG: hypothetical protein ACOYIP_01450 [Coriobacteriales bacterium]|jgi:hypothetical protein
MIRSTERWRKRADRPRGSGKTVLLSTISSIASEQGWIAVSVVAHEGMLEELIEQVHSKAGHLLKAPRVSEITSVQLGSIGVGREVLHSTGSWIR